MPFSTFLFHEPVYASPELCCTSLSWQSKVTVSLRLLLRFVVTCMNFVKKQEIVWKCHHLWLRVLDRNSSQWLHAILGMSQTLDFTPSFSAISHHSVSPGTYFLLFCFFDGSVSHSANTKWDDFLHVFPSQIVEKPKLHFGLENTSRLVIKLLWHFC